MDSGVSLDMMTKKASDQQGRVVYSALPWVTPRACPDAGVGSLFFFTSIYSNFILHYMQFTIELMCASRYTNMGYF